MSSTAILYPDHPAPVEPVRTPAYFVAVDGKDSWSGRLAEPNADGTDGPFASLTRARDAMRATDIDTTYVRGGTHTLSGPLELSAADNGVSFLGYPGETAVISGGERVTGFRSEGGGLFSAALAKATDLDLVIGGVRQTVAQTGDGDPDDPTAGWFFAPADGTKTTVRFSAGDVDPGMVETGVRIQTFDRERLADSIVAVDRVDPATGTIHLKSAVWYTVRAGGTYRLLNNDDFIRDAGEFGWRAEDGRLVVKPEDPTTFEQDGVVVPRLSTLVTMNGVSGATLAGLTFADTVWSGAAIRMTGSDGNRIGGNRFIDVGVGVKLSGSSYNLIDGNRLESLGGSGLDLSGGSDANTILANRFDRIGEVTKYVAAVSVAGGDDNLISHNEITHSPGYGISVKNWDASTVNTGTIVEYNRIRDVGRETADSAGIEMLGRSDLDTRAVIRGNSIDGVAGLATTSGGAWLENYKGFGVYLDDQTNGVAVTGNVIRNVGWAHVFIHGGDNNSVENNIGIMARNAEEFIRVEWVPLAGDAGIPRNNSIVRNVASGTVPVDDYWELWSANSPRIDQNLVFNTPRYGSGDVAASPLFIDAANGDFRLGAGSPAFALGIQDLAWGQMGALGYAASGATPSFWVGTAGLPTGIILPAAGSAVSVPPTADPSRTISLTIGEGMDGLLMAILPAGVGVGATGPAALQSPADAKASLVAGLAGLGAADATLLDGIAGFAAGRPSGSLLAVRSVVFTSQGVPAAPVVLTSSDNGDAAALVDARALAAGTTVQLDRVEFAGIVGPAIVTGGTGAEYVAGDGSAQTIRLGAGNDTILGGGGNDRLEGGAGDDRLDGGGGIDVACFAGRAAEHAVMRGADGILTVTDLRAAGTEGHTGTDRLSGIELLRFDDGVRLAAIPAGPVTVFDEALYRAANPDVAGAVQAGMFVSGLQHFQQFGWAEGRHALLTVDEAFYRAQNPDVDAAIKAGVFRSAAEHFILSGLKEGRTPNALFDTGYYLAQNADVAATVAAGGTTAYGHYCLYGWKEGRDPSPWFDTSEYLKQNPDVASSGTNPLSHLLDFGLREGRLAPAADAGWWG